jgi:hypothetical protein
MSGGYDGLIGKGFISALDVYLKSQLSIATGYSRLLKSSGLSENEFKMVK